jgi:hypothetical protein
MSSTYRSSRIALNVVSRTSRSPSLGPPLRKQVPAYRREASTVAEAEVPAAAVTTTTRQTNYPPPDVYDIPAQRLWKGKEATGLQDTLKHAYERELGACMHLRHFLRWSTKDLMATRRLLFQMDE